MKKEIWVNCTKQNLEGAAKLYGATGILGKSKLGLRSLDSPVYEIKSQKDIEKLPTGIDYAVLYFHNWKVIPAENLIAKYAGSGTKIIVKTNNLNEMRTLAKALEIGVDGFLVDDAKIIKEFCSAYNPNFNLRLVNATVTKIKQIELGKRVCVDCINFFRQEEGLLDGFTTGFMFLKDAETTENPYVNTREWRVNAGAASAYVLSRHNGVITPRYLDDLVSGDEVVAVDVSGKARIELIARLKIEKRPMTYIQAKYEGRIGATASQTAETVRLVTDKGSKPVTEIKEGDKLKAYVTEVVATHFGMPIKEKIIER